VSVIDVEKYPEIIRKLIEHENTLQNYRFTWFFASQALLFTALGVAFDKSAFVVCVICAIGGLTALTAFFALRLCDLAFKALGQWWEKNLDTYKGPPRQGCIAYPKWMALMPSRALPGSLCLLGLY
jgi:hypothetical protein